MPHSESYARFVSAPIRSLRSPGRTAAIYASVAVNCFHFPFLVTLFRHISLLSPSLVVSRGFLMPSVFVRENATSWQSCEPHWQRGLMWGWLVGTCPSKRLTLAYAHNWYTDLPRERMENGGGACVPFKLPYYYVTIVSNWKLRRCHLPFVPFAQRNICGTAEKA